MKVEIEHAPFHELINRAAKALASRPASPVLAGLSLRAEEGSLHASDEAIKAVALVAERNTPVRLEFATDQVTVVAGSGDQALARAKIEAIYDADEPVVIAVNPVYLIDGLGCLGTAYARLTYPEKVRPVVLTGVAAPGDEAGGEPDGEFRYLFIPVRASAQG
jgi:DNA polymerase-3 subunit beta